MSYERLHPTFTFDADRLEQLKAVAPEAFADGAINWETLRAALGDHLEDEGSDVEHFGLFWPGKRAARRRASEPSRGTLIPVPGEGVDEDTTRNLFIEADNLDALKLLQKSYAGRVKMIYIDPPYNTGNDFVYRDDFREAPEDYLRRTGQMGQKGQFLTTNAKSDGRFHSTWLNMIYSRLLLARTLLSEDGVIFISIDDNEVHNLRQIMNEIFGEENFVDCIIWKKRYGGGAKEKHLVTLHEYILFYARDVDNLEPIFIPTTQASIERYYTQTDDNHSTRGPYRTHPLEATKSMGDRPNLVFSITAPDGTEVWPRRQWLWSRERVKAALADKELHFLRSRDGNWSVHTKQYLREKDGETRGSKAFSVIESVYSQHGTNELLDIFGDAQLFPFPKPTDLIKSLLQIGTHPRGKHIVVDMFAGSGTTAQAILEANAQDSGNRQMVLIQLDEVTGRTDYPTIPYITRERIRRTIEKIRNARAGELFTKQSDELDLGFHSYRFAPSNYKVWQDYNGEDMREVEQTFDMFETPLIDGWQPAHLLIEVMLQLGFPLDSRIESLPHFIANAVQRVTSDFHAHSLYACFDATVSDETIAALSLGSEDIFVCLDSALTDQTKARLSDACNLRTI